MDCPTCGLANPPDALTCDCGYDFIARTPSEKPGWPIKLAWRQKVAAYWSISWPSWVASFIMAFGLTSRYRVDELPAHLPVIALAGHLAFFVIQAVLTRRLVQKNYRSFRVGVLCENGQQDRRLSMREAGSVWLWILGPQLALLLIASVLVWWYGAKLPPETVRSISSLSLWLRFLVVGLYAVDLALRVNYSGFRLQAYGYRYV
jgi:hypothetical protein